MTPDPTWRPPHAYVPGRTPRHPEDLFDPLKADIVGHPPARLHETRAWAFGRAFLAEGYFWEAHEVFEAVWMACPPNSPEKLLLQSIIQRANAGLKREMGMVRAVARLTHESDRLAGEAFGRAKREIFGIASEMQYNADYG